MELYYTIVLSVAVIVLIILLTYVGILMQKKQGSSQPFPPIKNTCPDKWTSKIKKDEDGDDTVLCEIPGPNGTNIGTMLDNINSDNTPGYAVSDAETPATIDFNHDGWSAQGTNADCARKNWANKFGVVWDGITNYNMC